MNPQNKPRILFVDDEPHVLDALRRTLRFRGRDWDMVFVGSPPDALAEQRRAPFDVAVVDMIMPVMSGLDLIAALTRECRRTTAIMLTGAADLETAIAAINEAEVFRFYTKPCAAEVLSTGIDEALSQAATRTTAVPPEAAFGMATLNRLPIGVVVVDSAPRVLFMNRQGAEFLAEGDGLSIGPTGLCHAARPSETQTLHALIKAAVDGHAKLPAGAVSLTRIIAERPLSVVVAPLEVEGGGPPVAVLLVGDLEHQPLPSADTISRLFDLTEAESRLALALAQGQRIDDAAEELGITVSSARTYLKRIFSKTETDRQSELVRLVLAAPTLLDLGAGGWPESAAFTPKRKT